jgi:hypothetical protein
MYVCVLVAIYIIRVIISGGNEVGWACCTHGREEEYMKGSGGEARRKET